MKKNIPNTTSIPKENINNNLLMASKLNGLNNLEIMKLKPGDLKENYSLIEISNIPSEKQQQIEKNIIEQNKHYMSVVAMMIVKKSKYRMK